MTNTRWSIVLDTLDQAVYLIDTIGMDGARHHTEIAEDTHATVIMSGDDLDILAGLTDEDDGYFDGTHVWIGGRDYPVVRADVAAEEAFHQTGQRNAIGGYIGCDGPQCWGLIQQISADNLGHKIQEAGRRPA
jgi:hypothetical protein